MAKKLKKAEGGESPLATVVAAKAALNETPKARNEVQEGVDMLCAHIFQLYGNLLTDEARQPLKKIVKV